MVFRRSAWISALAACAIASGPAVAQTTTAGQKIAEKFCAGCHGIKPEQKSKHRSAPEFNVIANRYSVWGLQEALAEGIIVGHIDMPQFAFSPAQIDNLLTYMDTFTRKDGTRKKDTRSKGQPQ